MRFSPARRSFAVVLSAALVLLLGSWPAMASTGRLSPLVDKHAAGTLAAGALGAASKAKEIHPCMTPDPGFGIYDKWSRNITMGQLLAPQQGGLTAHGGFDLVVHFHGHYPIRKEFVKTAKGIVLVAIDLGIGSGAYSQAFASPTTFERLIASVEAEMARRSGVKRAKVRKLALSSWSAGYGAIGQILSQPAGANVDALILLDSVHAGYEEGSDKLKTRQIEPFIKFARRAMRGSRFMFQSYSSIIPPGYASTREVSHYMVEKLGGKIKKAKRNDPLGLTMFERYDRGKYHVRGYRGNDKPDHCAHLGLMRDIVKIHLNNRWHTPLGRVGKAQLSKARSEAIKSGRTHDVKKGETLGGIARKYGVTTSQLRDANGLRKGKPIRIGQTLILPKEADAKAPSLSASTPKREAPKEAPKGGAKSPQPRKGESVYLVKSGDSLTRIAKHHGVTVKALRERNGLKRGSKKRIQPKQKLIIPAKNK